MTEEETLLQAVLDNPHEDAPRLAYADGSVRQALPGTPQALLGEFIRLQIELSRREPPEYQTAGEGESLGAALREVERMKSSDREKELRERYGVVWGQPVASLLDRYTFDRGFVAHVTLSASDFLLHARILARLAPILLLSLTEARPVARALFASPHLLRYGALDLSNNGLDSDDIHYLARSPYLRNLWWLDLGWNKLDLTGCHRLARSRYLSKLVYLGLTGNPTDPHETAGTDGYTIVDASLPPAGQALESSYGTLRWLHYATDSIADYPPPPLRRPPE